MTTGQMGTTGPGAGAGLLLRSERSPVMSGLQSLLEETEFAWSLGLIGEDQAGKLATLTGDLRRRASGTGDGKRFTSGFAYLGVEPAIAWANACRDRLYPVMQESIMSFDQRWLCVRPALGSQSYHYVSLGPGDGQKDAVILQDLRRDCPEMCYVAVDMSAEMLRLGVGDLIRRLKLPRSQILPVQLDFSEPCNLAALRDLLDRVFGSEPVLFSLLGNTMANFEDDAELLRMLTGTLLREQDRFLLEVATTADLNETLAEAAAEEYERSRTFREFVTSALMHNTDLHIDMGSVLFQGSMEGQRALLVKTVYKNQTGREVRLTLPDRTNIPFPHNDTIRLCVSRKYAEDSLDSVLLRGGTSKVHSTHFDFAATQDRARFGMELVVLRADSGLVVKPTSSMADDIWHG